MTENEMLNYLADYLNEIAAWQYFKEWIEEKGYNQSELPAPFNEE